MTGEGQEREGVHEGKGKKKEVISLVEDLMSTFLKNLYPSLLGVLLF